MQLVPYSLYDFRVLIISFQFSVACRSLISKDCSDQTQCRNAIRQNGRLFSLIAVELSSLNRDLHRAKQLLKSREKLVLPLIRKTLSTLHNHQYLFRRHCYPARTKVKSENRSNLLLVGRSDKMLRAV